MVLPSEKPRDRDVFLSLRGDILRRRCGFSVSENQCIKENLKTKLCELLINQKLLNKLSQNSLKTAQFYSKKNATIITEKLKIKTISKL